MLNPSRFTEYDRVAVLKTLAEEQRLKLLHEPYSEAVITACEMVLRANPDPLPAPHGYWWEEY